VISETGIITLNGGCAASDSTVNVLLNVVIGTVFTRRLRRVLDITTNDRFFRRPEALQPG
jgi:hypothetical protein